MVHSLQVSLVKLEGPYDFIGLTWLGEPVIPNEIGWSECIRQVNRSEYWVAIPQATVMLGVGLRKVRACYESSVWGFSIKLAKCNEEGD